MQVSKGIRDFLFYKMEQKLNIKEIIDYPLIGRVIKSLKDEILIIEKDPPTEIDGVHFKFKWDYENNLIQINVGSKWTGPVLKWDPNYKWVNIYNYNNYGNDYADGGGSECNLDLRYDTWQQALDGRNYIGMCDLLLRDCRFRESTYATDHVSITLHNLENS